MSNDGVIATVGNQGATVSSCNSRPVAAGNGNAVLVAGTGSVVTAGSGRAVSGEARPVGC